MSQIRRVSSIPPRDEPAVGGDVEGINPVITERDSAEQTELCIKDIEVLGSGDVEVDRWGDFEIVSPPWLGPGEGPLW